MFYEGNNSCGNSIGDAVPSNLVALIDDENLNNIKVSWDPVAGEGYGYVVYRDGMLYRLIPEGTSFVDENVPDGGHCYYVGYLFDGGENGQYSNESCASAGACYAPTDIDFEYTGSSYKIKLKWDRPEASEGLSGYYLYRKDGEDGTYQRIKLLGASATNYTDNSANQEGMYYYRLYAYYREIDCMSAPATTKNDPNKYYLKVYYSPTDVAEREAVAINVFPNPADQSLKIEAEGMTQVSVYNMLGQQVYASACESNVLSVNVSGWSEGVYLMKVQTAEGIVSRRVTIVH